MGEIKDYRQARDYGGAMHVSSQHLTHLMGGEQENVPNKTGMKLSPW